MITIAYLSNQYPSPVEPYVVEEIESLRGQGFRVVACSARKPQRDLREDSRAQECVCLQSIDAGMAWRAAGLGIRSFPRLWPVMREVAFQGGEFPPKRLRAGIHTLLGLYLAAALERRGVTHIHVHHGYFSAWIAMVAASVLGITYSMTLHGSDLLLRAPYLDVKLKHCKFCLTVSGFNRDCILQRYPEIRPPDVLVQHIGIAVPSHFRPCAAPVPETAPVLLAIGRLHPVKDHEFLLRACQELKRRGVVFRCRIAGEGPARRNLERTIRELDLVQEVRLLGHLSRETLAAEYAQASLVALTSRSEGIPLVLMEAMAHGKPVLAPHITGIPELVTAGVTGFLYRPGSQEDFVQQTQAILQSPDLRPITEAAYQHVRRSFNRDKNLVQLAELLTRRLTPAKGCCEDANPLLQQVQLSL